MKITIRDLRAMIRGLIRESGGGTTLPHMPRVRDSIGPDFSDREQLGRISTKDADKEDELPPHLREPVHSEEDCWGPVPPTSENPYSLPDPYTKDYGVLPTPPIKR